MKTWTQFGSASGRSFLSDLKGREEVSRKWWVEPLLWTSAVSLHCTALWLPVYVHFAVFFKELQGVHRPLAGGSLGHLPSRQGQQTLATCGPITKMSTSSTPTSFAACAVWVSMWSFFIPCLGLRVPDSLYSHWLTGMLGFRNLGGIYSLWAC